MKTKAAKLPAHVQKSIANRRVDGWQNILTGLGIMGKDKRMSSVPAPRQFQRQECDDLYRADDVCRKVVHKLPAESFREGYQFLTEDDSSDEQVAWLEKKIKSLNVNYLMQKAWWMARLYGGAAIVLGIEDGQKMSDPVDLSNIRGITWANVFDRWQLTYQDVQRDLTSSFYGKPERFKLTTHHGVAFGDGSNTIHRSRIVFFDGHELTDLEFIKNAYWHASILESIFQPLSNFNAAHDGSASLVGDFAQSVYKLKNLTELLSADRDDLVMKRLALIDKTRSIVNALVIEEGEEFERKTTNVSGLSELIEKASQRLVAACEMPHNLIMGDGAKGGLGSEGQTEARDWYDTVATAQETYLRPRLERIVQILNLCKTNATGGLIDTKIRVVFKPLWQETESTTVAMRLAQAQTDQIYLTNGVIDPDEVAQSRFGGTEYSIETNLTSSRAVEIPEISEGATPAQPIEKSILNGAQIQSVLQLLGEVSSGLIPRSSAVSTMIGGLGLSTAQAEAMMGEIGRGFVSVEEKQKQADLQKTTEETAKIDGMYEGIDFTVPVEIKDAMAIGLQTVAQYFPEFADAPLVNEARDIVNGVGVGPMKIVKMCQYFSRAPVPAAQERNGQPSKQLMVWNLNGSDWGSTWCEQIKGRMAVAEGGGNAGIQ